MRASLRLLVPHLLVLGGAAPAADFLPAGNGNWHTATNWSPAGVPNGPGARARIGEPTADRYADLTAPVTVGELVFETGGTAYRNRIRAQTAATPLRFEDPSGTAWIRVNGTGAGYAEFDLASEIWLATGVTVEVNNAVGSPDFGAARLRGRWAGPGGLTKTGNGLASLTGAEKIYAGTTVVARGVLQITEPASMSATASISVQPGGQLRLVSGGTFAEPRVHTFGGPLRLDSLGRAGVGSGENLGVLGALRYETGVGTNRAIITSPVAITGASDLHVGGAGNLLELTGPLSGTAGWVKSGAGALKLATDSPLFTAPATVDNGLLEMAGHIASPVQLAANGSLRGHGTCGAITGSGLLELDRTVLRSRSLAGVRCRFVFTTAGPDFAQPAASGNGLLMTDAVPAAPAEVSIHLDTATPPGPADRFRGAFLLPAGSDWTRLLVTPAPRVYRPDPAGTHAYGGRSWSQVAEARLTRVPVDDSPGAAEILEVRLDGAPTRFADWQVANFSAAELGDPAISGAAASPAGDGVANLLRYALGIPRGGNANPLLPELRPGGVFGFSYDPARFDITYQVEASSRLDDWSSAAVLFDSAVATAPAGWLEITDPQPGAPRFYRLKVRLR